MRNFYWRWWEARNGGLSLWWGNRKFLKSLYIGGRGVLIPLFYEDPLYCQLPPFFFFQILSTSLSPPTLIPVFFLLSCFFGWMSDLTTFDVLFYLMIIWIYTCWALVFQLCLSFFKFRKQHWLKNCCYTFFTRSRYFWLPKIWCFWFLAKVQTQIH